MVSNSHLNSLNYNSIRQRDFKFIPRDQLDHIYALSLLKLRLRSELRTNNKLFEISDVSHALTSFFWNLCTGYFILAMLFVKIQITINNQYLTEVLNESRSVALEGKLTYEHDKLANLLIKLHDKSHN